MGIVLSRFVLMSHAALTAPRPPPQGDLQRRLGVVCLIADVLLIRFRSDGIRERASGWIRHRQRFASASAADRPPATAAGYPECRTGLDLDMAEIADDEDVGMAGWHGSSQGEALGCWDQRIVAAVDQQKMGAQVAQLATGEVEKLDVAAHRTRARPRPVRARARDRHCAPARSRRDRRCPTPPRGGAHRRRGRRAWHARSRSAGCGPRGSGTREALARTNTHLAIGSGLP